VISVGIDRASGPAMAIKSFRDLEAWKQGMTLVEHCYKASRHFPIEERYGLTAQMRRAAISIPSNVAEGHSRKTTGAYANHVSIASGSGGELETCIVIAERLGFLPPPEAWQLVERCAVVSRILTGLYSSLEVKLLTSRSVPNPRNRERRPL
jgi:four helix bundle protein